MISIRLSIIFFFFFFNDTATTEIYTLSLHDALPIFDHHDHVRCWISPEHRRGRRSEEHTSELQSPYDLVCRLLLEKKKIKKFTMHIIIKKLQNKSYFYIKYF